VQASKCQGITGVDSPLKTTQAMQSLPFFPCKVKFEDPLPKLNEKHDTFNGKYRQYGAVLNHQETTNGHFVQSITKKKKLDNTYSSAPSEWLSGRHPGELEVERQRKLTRGKAVEDQLVCPKFEEIQRDNLPRYKAGKEHVVKATIKKKSKSSKYRKINNNTDFQAQCMVGRVSLNCLGFTTIISLKETVEGLSDLGVFTLSGIFYIRDIEVGLSVGYF